VSISAPFIARPVATILLTFGVALSGVVAFGLLPVAPLPKIELPAIFVSAQLPGASPEVMASSVATPLERHLGAIADVDDMTSTSSVGSTNIALTFGLGRNLDGAARDVQAALVAAHPDLPSAMTKNPFYRKLNSSNFPIMTVTLTSDILTAGQIYDAADAVISQRIAQIPGVGSVNVSGSALPAVRVEVNPLALSQYGIGLQDITAAISNSNANAPKGAIDLGDQRWQVYTNDNARDAAQYRSLIIANRSGRTVRLGDVAQVHDMQDGATENSRTFGLYNGHPAISVDVVQQPGANIIKVVDAVRAQLPQLARMIDPKINLVVTTDRSVSIRASLRQVERTLVLAVAMVIWVVFAFLRSVRAALIPTVVVPVSLIGTFAAMYFLGYSLDNFSLMALTIATGFVVDDAIVVMENIIRLIESGVPRRRAALQGAREVGFTVLSMSLSLVAVFAPFQIMSGILGSLFREFTVTLTLAILISLVLSLTTTPMLCAYLLPRGRTQRGTRFGDYFGRAFTRLHAAYGRSLDWALDRRRLMLGILVAAIGLNIFLYLVIPKSFFPEQDTGGLRGVIRGDAPASFQFMKDKLTEVSALLQRDPAVESVVGSVGGGGGGPMFGGATSATLSITLKPLAQRHLSAAQVIGRLRPTLARVAGVSILLQSVQDLGGGGGRSANAEYQYSLLGDDVAELRSWSVKLQHALRNAPELADVDSDLQPGGLQSNVVIDRDTASRLGLSIGQIDSQLSNAFSQAQVSTIYNYNSPQQYHVILELAPSFLQRPENLQDMYFSTAGGPVSGTQATQALSGTTIIGKTSNSSSPGNDVERNLAANSLANAGRGNTSTGSAISAASETVVPLAAFAHLETSTTPVSVTHTGTSASTSFAFNLPPGGTLSAALAAIDRTIDQVHMPTSIRGTPYGNADLFQRNQGNLPLLVLAAFLAIYVVLGMLYESYSQPLTILSTLPSAGIGALLALMLVGEAFSLISFLGIMLLIGIVMKNAIMMVDVAVAAQRTQGMTPRAAIAHACVLRFRPIMMTTAAAIAGALPLAIAHGDGTELRRPLGISVIGGLIVSQVLTLYTTPVVYLYIDRLRAWSERRRVLRDSPAPFEGSPAV
jgi:multidrug efflux pump